jgi:hypothetical protein
MATGRARVRPLRPAIMRTHAPEQGLAEARARHLAARSHPQACPVMKLVYLAGPEVFLPDAVAQGAALKAL